MPTAIANTSTMMDLLLSERAIKPPHVIILSKDII